MPTCGWAVCPGAETLHPKRNEGLVACSIPGGDTWERWWAGLLWEDRMPLSCVGMQRIRLEGGSSHFLCLVWGCRGYAWKEEVGTAGLRMEWGGGAEQA